MGSDNDEVEFTEEDLSGGDEKLSDQGSSDNDNFTRESDVIREAQVLEMHMLRKAHTEAWANECVSVG